MGIVKTVGLYFEGLAKIQNGLGNVAQGVGTVAQGAGKAVKNIAESETTKELFRFMGETSLEIAQETKSVIQKIWRWINETAAQVIKFIERIVKTTLDIVVSWFKNRNIKENEVAFSLTEQLRNGEYKIIQGIFSKINDDVIQSRQIDSQEVDDLLKKEEIILYT